MLQARPENTGVPADNELVTHCTRLAPEDRNRRHPDLNPIKFAHGAGISIPPAVSNQTLLARQHQQLRIRRQNLPDSFLVLPPCFHLPAHLVNKVLRDILDMLPAVRHVGEGPLRVPWLIVQLKTPPRKAASPNSRNEP